MGRSFIGLDIGTTTITGLVYDLDEQAVHHRITEEHQKGFLQASQEWERIQDANAIVQQALHIIDKLLQERPDAAGIGLTGQMHGIVYVDEQGSAVSPLYTWQDGRGGQPVPGLSTSFAEQISRMIGTQVSPGYGLATHAYNLKFGLVPEEAVTLCTIADYAASQLVRGQRPKLDATQASAIGGYRSELEDFDREAIKQAGLNAELLPEIVPSGSLLGYTAEKIPVYVSLGDNQASYLGSVKAPLSTVLLNIGTGSQLSVYLQAAPDGELPSGMEARPFPGGGVLMVGAALSGGRSYAMLERFFREVLTSFTGQKLDSSDVYAYMEQLLLQTTDQERGLAVRPYFLGTRSDPGQRGSIEQISLDNFTPGTLAHAFLKGMVEELYAFYEQLLSIMPTASAFMELVGSGNALRSNRILRAKAEEIFGLPMKLTSLPEEAAVGAALCAAVGLGEARGFQSVGTYLVSE